MKVIKALFMVLVLFSIVALILEPVVNSILSVALPIDNALYWFFSVSWVLTMLSAPNMNKYSLKGSIIVYLLGVLLSLLGIYQLSETLFRISFILLVVGVVGHLLAYKKNSSEK